MCSGHLHFEPVEVTTRVRIMDSTNAVGDLEMIEAKAKDLLAEQHPRGCGPWHDTASSFELHYAFVAILDGMDRGRILQLKQVEFVTTMEWKS